MLLTARTRPRHRHRHRETKKRGMTMTAQVPGTKDNSPLTVCHLATETPPPTALSRTYFTAADQSLLTASRPKMLARRLDRDETAGAADRADRAWLTWPKVLMMTDRASRVSAVLTVWCNRDLDVLGAMLRESDMPSSNCGQLVPRWPGPAVITQKRHDRLKRDTPQRRGWRHAANPIAHRPPRHRKQT